jgi:hypothetical protein
MSFDNWLAEVDKQIENRIGWNIKDLPSFDYLVLFLKGFSSDAVASIALNNAKNKSVGFITG